MRRIASIGLLVLLLCNMFGLSFAILCFEKDYQVASVEGTGDKIMKLYLPSLPYSEQVELSDPIEGLIRRDGDFYNATHVLHENDTLYVTLQTNEAARDHFFELANAMQVLRDPQSHAPQNPYSKAVKLMSDLLKNYISGQQPFEFTAQKSAARAALPIYISAASNYLSHQELLSSPPPELG